jgi:sterol desaturase/sphingolipid hydroxylase (fatty acid hydroxylase superfamily)
MHHADVGLDTTTGVRFHPIEIAASLVWKMGLVVALGAPPLAVLAFEVILNATSLFNHANLALPRAVDRWLRLAVVTPDMHRVHHSTSPREFNTNLGFNLPWWDRAFGTYKAQPDQGHETMKLGLNIFRDPRWLALHRMLVMPFR